VGILKRSDCLLRPRAYGTYELERKGFRAFVFFARCGFLLTSDVDSQDILAASIKNKGKHKKFIYQYAVCRLTNQLVKINI
jgi:hypothetical protein